jgi:hypothetical protein
MELNNSKNKNMEQLQTREAIEVPGIDTYPVGEESISAITKVEGDDAIGNVLVRSCLTYSDKLAEVKAEKVASGMPEKDALAAATKAATEFCLATCALRESTFEQNQIDGVICPEKNTLEALNRLGIKPEDAMIIAVTANEVGFSDEFDEYEAAGKAITNPEGWKQVNGFNAFFSDVADTPVLARRLADCGDLNIEFKTKEGQMIIGFMHLTRPNQYGPSTYPETQNGLPYTEYALKKALEHYGDVDLASVRLVLRSAIEKQDFVFRFDSQEKMDKILPGWAEGGYLENKSNSDWKPGDNFEPGDIFWADFRAIVEDSIRTAMSRLGINESQFDDNHLIDTMHDPSHSSDQRDKQMNVEAHRDLYITAHRSALKN